MQRPYLSRSTTLADTTVWQFPDFKDNTINNLNSIEKVCFHFALQYRDMAFLKVSLTNNDTMQSFHRWIMFPKLNVKSLSAIFAPLKWGLQQKVCCGTEGGLLVFVSALTNWFLNWNENMHWKKIYYQLSVSTKLKQHPGNKMGMSFTHDHS